MDSIDALHPVATFLWGWIVWSASSLFDRDAIYNLWLPLSIGLSTVIITVLANHAVRLHRLKRIHGFSQTFAPPHVDRRPRIGGPPPIPSASNTQSLRDIRYSPSLEFVITKYITDLDEVMERPEFEKLKKLVRMDDDSAEIDYAINNIRCFQMPANRRMLFYAVPFLAAVTVGWMLTIATGRMIDPLGSHLVTLSGDKLCRLNPVMLSVAFLGAYVSALTLLIRAVALFDLSATTFLRSVLQLVGSIAAAIVVWNVLLAIFGTGFCDSRWSGLALPFLFALGFVPDAGLQFVISSFANSWNAPDIANMPQAGGAGSAANYSAGLLAFLKLTDGRFAAATKSVPLDVIDGIDFFTRFRLVEAGIYEVQNLAVANPILLHVETPFGIYQTIDWVGQAQLCAVVGPERFLIFRQFNIRTVFDLERAVLSLKSTTQFRQIIGGILMMPTETLRQVEKLGGSQFPDMTNPNGAPKSATDYSKWAVEAAKNPAQYRIRLPEPLTPPSETGYRVWPLELPVDLKFHASFLAQNNEELQIYSIYERTEDDATIKHMVRVIMDDLHVMRLRQIWESISRTLGADAATLDDSEDAFLGA